MPRPETEMIVEEALSYVHKRELSNKMLQIVDLGVGSGAILVSLLKELPRAVGFGVDISFKALEMAVINAKYHGVDERFFPICGNFGGALTGLFDIIVSNPPYIGLSEKDNLSIDVREFDPFKALFAGYDGLKAYRDLFPFIRKHLKADGLAVLEHGKDQAIALQKMAKSADLCVFETFLDMADLPRFLKILGNDRINS